jgi:hypothetical protein
MTHIECHDAARPLKRKSVNPPVDAPMSRQRTGRVEAKRVERMRELDPAASHPDDPVREGSLPRRIDQRPGLGHH